MYRSTKCTSYHSLLYLLRKLFKASYVPHDKAVDGTLMHIRGNTPFVNAHIPSFLYTYLIVDRKSEYLTFLTSNSQSLLT